MHAKTVQIAWHKAQSISSLDFCPSPSDPLNLKFATAGQDNAVRLWAISSSSSSSSSDSHYDTDSVSFLSTLHGHLAGVNIVRWAPSPTSTSTPTSTSAVRLASADNAGSILLWSPSPTPTFHATLAGGDTDEDPSDYKEHWRATHVLQGHKHEVNDIAWSPCGKYLASVGTDQTLRIWQVPPPPTASSSSSAGTSSTAQVIGSAHDHSDVIQGVAWDPRGQLVATQAVDRAVYVYAVTMQAVPGAAGRKVAVLKKVAECKNGAASKLYSDPTTTPTSFFRRLAFSPDGSLLVTPAGLLALAPNNAPTDTTSTAPAHAVHVYTRALVPLAQPSLSLPGYASPAWCIRFCPTFFHPHSSAASQSSPKSLALPYRMLFAVGSDDALVLYDTSHLDLPLAVLKNLHVYRYQDIAWSPNGNVLVAASHDGYCSLIVLAADAKDREWLRKVQVGDPEYPFGAPVSATSATSANTGATAAAAHVVPNVGQVQPEQPQVHILQVKKKRIQPTLISAFAAPSPPATSLDSSPAGGSGPNASG
ncbi:WD40-repeat-containing domain protein [Catenaria anguillulae PL171]|uniref:WD40-repeat-containing domain protein n=1 Tax=Catenaria anguillulae PL171 TaxID=765915 RepID=A0A1Y2H6X0_9FUNG|nr:WD40-repeat-containing domain protein [Catenaria anguillulae PL171]